MKTANPQPDLAVATTQPIPPPAAIPPTSLDILDAAVRGGVTSENVAVVKEIIAMRRDELKEQAKADFAKAFFKLKKTLSTTTIYADKDGPNNAYTYCSETEISDRLEPILMANGFAMMFGQRKDATQVTAIITLIHEGGHSEDREYTVRVGPTNNMKGPDLADAGSTTTAWRHLAIKMFGLKSHICESDDARNLGDLAKKITKEQADELEHRLKMVNGKVADFLTLAGAASFAEIPAANYGICDRLLKSKERRPA